MRRNNPHYYLKQSTWWNSAEEPFVRAPMTKLEPLPYRRGDGEDIERVGEDGAPPD
jgi:hypothetical protein